MPNNTFFLRFIKSSYLKLHTVFEPIFRLNEVETEGGFLKSTYFKFFLSPTVKLPYKLGRSIRGNQFDSSKDIYSRVVMKILNNESLDEIIKMLYDEYQDYKYKSVSDINNFLTSSKIKSYPSWLMVLPWENSDIKTLKKNYLNSFYKNRSANGMSFTNKKSEHIENRIFSYDTARSHVHQFNKLIIKIKHQGYIENNDDYPTAVILVKNNKWRWIMSSSGNHRAHIKKDLNFNSINCKVIGIVNFSKLNKFKNVVNEIFNEKEATILFENIFEGQEPIRGPI